MKHGVLNEVIEIMKYKEETMSELEKLTILSFDEVHLSNRVDIDRRE